MREFPAIIRRFLRLRYLALVAALVLVTYGAMGALAWSTINRAGGLKTYIESQISDPSRGIAFTMSSAEIIFEFSRYPVQIKAADIQIETPEVALSLSRSTLGFSPIDLLLANISPRLIELEGIALTAEYHPDGWHSEVSLDLLLGVLRLQETGEDESAEQESNDWGGNIDHLRITGGQIIVNYPATESGQENTSITLDPIEIDLRRDGNRLNGLLLIDSSEIGDARIDFTTDADFSTAALTITFSELDGGRAYPYLGFSLPELRNSGRLSGQVRLAVVDRKITQISGDIDALAGRIVIPSLGLVHYDDASAIFSFDQKQDVVTVSKFVINASQNQQVSGNFSLAGEIRSASSETPVVIVTLSGRNIILEPWLKRIPDETPWINHPRFGRAIRGGTMQKLMLNGIGVIDRPQEKIDITQLAVQADLGNMRLETGGGSIDRFAGTLAASLDFAIGGSGELKRASAKLLLTDAVLLPVKAKRIVEIEGIEILASLDDNIIDITRAAIDAKHLGKMALATKLHLDKNLKLGLIETAIKAEQVDKNLAVELWPPALYQGARSWLERRVRGGVINGLEIAFAINTEEDRAKMLFAKGKGRLTHAEVAYLDTMPPIKDTDANITVTSGEGQDATLALVLEQGVVNGVDIAGSDLTIHHDGVKTLANLTLVGAGKLGKAIESIDELPLDFLPPEGLSIGGDEGEVDFSGSVKWIFPKTSKDDVFSTMEIVMSATAMDATILYPAYDVMADNTMLEALFDRGDMKINGIGRFNGAPGKLSLHFVPQGSRDITITLPESPEMTDYLGTKFDLEVIGETSGIITINRASKNDPPSVGIAFDLTKAGFYLPQLDLTKLVGEEAEFQTRLDVSKGYFSSARDLEMTSDALTTKGWLDFNDDGTLSEGHFSTFEWSGNTLRNITVVNEHGHNIAISAEAGVMDLRPLRSTDGSSGRLALDLNLSADRFILDDRLSFAGKVSITTNEVGKGEADFLGDLYLNNEPFITQASLTALFGNSGESMQGSGLIDGVGIDIVLRTKETGGEVMVLKTANAGRVLKALDIVDSIKDGDMNMIVEFEPNNRDHFILYAKLTDFKIIEAPFIVRLMSVLSHTGIFSFLQDGSAVFTEGRARIEVTPDTRKIHSARATGDALAIDLVGVIDQNSGAIEISGVLLPIHLITKLLGYVPLVGEILTGVNNEGFFATQFSITGTMDEPETEVNLSSVAPGLIRDIFSPNWIENERSRILDESNELDEPENAQ